MAKGRLAPLALGGLAVAVGVAFLWDVGALPGMGSRNLLAFVLGLIAGWAAHKIAHLAFGAALLFGLANAVLLYLLVAGIEVDGVRRWLALGPLTLQPGLFLAPLLLAIVASREGRHWRVAILLPLLLVALQPDTATMIALAGGTAALMAAASGRSSRGWTARRIATALGAACVALVGLVFAGVQTPPPVAFVEGTVEIAAVSGGLAVLLHAAALMFAVGALLAAGGPAGASLAAYFALAALAATFWAFPMPVAGAGPSHLLGYGLAIGWLSERAAAGQRRSGPLQAG